MTRLEQSIVRAQRWLAEKPIRADLAAVLVLTLLWVLFFWRALTPNPVNQVSYPEGDFSGQFVAFAAYQARRLLAGEIPLWNPYNYAGHPFLADTQSAVFYPPRLVTIAVSRFTGGLSYAALQAEALAHYWLGGLFMYLFARTVTRSAFAGLVGALTVTYGGYLTGYPPLQLAVLEAGIWLPLALMGVFLATEQPGRWHAGWLALSALALGLSLLAGHPQTTLFLLYVLISYTIHRAARARSRWLPATLALGAVVALGFGLAAVQVLPGLEYTRLTVRSEMGVDALSGGFPFRDLLVLVLPNVLTLWSPLYSGIAALALAGVAVWRRREGALFWAAVAGVALVLSFGGATVLYRLAYLLAPGASWFRGQERAAYVVAHSLAILAAMGVAALREPGVARRPLSHALGIAAALAWAAAVQTFLIGRFTEGPEPVALINGLFFLAILATAAWVIIGRLAERAPRPWWGVAIVALVVFDLFSLNSSTNWEPVPAAARELYHHEMVDAIQEDGGLFRVDGRVGLSHGNYGTFAGVQDIRGISPLLPSVLDRYARTLPEYRLYELLNVQYVMTDWQELERPSTIVARDESGAQPVYLHRLDAPLPRAWMAYQVAVTPDDAQALGWLADPAFDPRATVILPADPGLDLPAGPPAALPAGPAVAVQSYAPEHIALAVDTPADGMLVLSELHYPGWRATIDGERAEIWRANAGLRALPLEAGQHEVVLVYRPLSFTLGAVVSLISLAAVALGMIAGRRRLPSQAESA